MLKSVFRRRTVSLDQVRDLPAPEGEGGEVLRAVLSLPQKYREVIYLHYYEGYTAPEMGKLLGRNVNTIYTDLTRAREKLKTILGGEADE